MDKYTVNEVLCYVTSQYDQLNRENLHSTLVEFYNREELSLAKQLLITQCEKDNLSNHINEFKKNRIGSNVVQRVAKDILDIWEIVDHEIGGSLTTEFVAADPNRLPSVNADKYNLKFLVSIILKLQEECESQKSQLESVIDSVASLHSKIPSLDATPAYASPLPHTPVVASPRRLLPVPKVNERAHTHLNVNTPTFIPRQVKDDTASSSSEPASSTSTTTTTTVSLTTTTPTSSAVSSAPKVPVSSQKHSASAAPPAVPSSVASEAISQALEATPSTASRPTVSPAPDLPEPPISSTPASSSSSSAKEKRTKTFASTTAASPRWNLVQARNKKKIVPITGQVVKKDDDELEGVPPIVRDFWDLSVSRLKETATADKVRSHLHKYGIEVKDVFILSSKIRGTKSAKVRVAREHRERAKSPDIWPQHCKIADWVNFKTKERPVPKEDNGSL